MSVEVTVPIQEAHKVLVAHAMQADTLKIALEEVGPFSPAEHALVGKRLEDWLRDCITLADTVLVADGVYAIELRIAAERSRELLTPFLDSLVQTQGQESTRPPSKQAVADAQSRIDDVYAAISATIGAIETAEEYRRDTSLRRIFISYDTREVDIALWFASILEARLGASVRVFVAKRDLRPGDDYLRVMLEENLRRADVLVALCSELSHTSPWLWWEASAVWAQGRLVVPVFIDIAPAAFPGPISLVCQGRQLMELEELRSAIAAVVTKLAPGVTNVPVTEDEFKQLAARMGGDRDKSRIRSADRRVLEAPLRVYFESSKDVERAVALATASLRLREVESSIAAMRRDISSLRTAQATSQASLEEYDDRLQRHGPWMGVSEHLHIHRSRISFCETMISKIRERIQALNGEAGSIQREMYTLEAAAPF